jgi:hypothetical protein
VSIRRAEQIEDGGAYVEAEHDAYPLLRFALSFTEDGVLRNFAIDNVAFSTPLRRKILPVLPVSRRLLAELPLGELEDAARARVNADKRKALRGEFAIPEGAEWLREVARQQLTKSTGAGRPALDSVFLARIAELYLQVAKDSNRPLEDLRAIKLDDLQLPAPRETVKGWVKKARERGILSEVPAGKKKGGSLTKFGEALLRMEADRG